MLTAGLRRSPDQTEFLVLRGSVLGRLQRYKEAELDLRRVLRLHPSHAPAQFELGLLLWRRGLVQEAAACFQRALDFSPTMPRPTTTSAKLSTSRADLPGARAALERAIELNPSDAKTGIHLLGRVLDRMNLTEAAQEMYRRGRELAGL